MTVERTCFILNLWYYFKLLDGNFLRSICIYYSIDVKVVK